jgi:dTDP-4-dehydrorhamnose reductase
MIKVLITGATGMLGQALCSILSDEYEIFTTSTGKQKLESENYRAFDLRQTDYKSLINDIDPEVIIHCAAITNVNLCEEDHKLADDVNSNSVLEFLNVMNKKTHFIYISTDAVFGIGKPPFKENDPLVPINYYGKSKLGGERKLMEFLNLHTVIRTTIVGQNLLDLNYGLVSWALNSVKTSEITAYEDSYFSPITAWQLAEELKYVINEKLAGIWHISGEESYSKYEFIKKLIEKFDKKNISRVKPGLLKNVNNSGKRVLNQSLSVESYINKTNRKLPNLEEVIEDLRNNIRN